MFSAEDTTELPGSKALLPSGTLKWAEKGPSLFLCFLPSSMDADGVR